MSNKFAYFELFELGKSYWFRPTGRLENQQKRAYKQLEFLYEKDHTIIAVLSMYLGWYKEVQNIIHLCTTLLSKACPIFFSTKSPNLVWILNLVQSQLEVCRNFVQPVLILTLWERPNQRIVRFIAFWILTFFQILSKFSPNYFLRTNMAPLVLRRIFYITTSTFYNFSLEKVDILYSITCWADKWQIVNASTYNCSTLFVLQNPRKFSMWKNFSGYSFTGNIPTTFHFSFRNIYFLN